MRFTSVIILGISYFIFQFLFGLGKGFFMFISILIIVNSLLVILTPLQIINIKTLVFLYICFLVIEYLIPYLNAC